MDEQTYLVSNQLIELVPFDGSLYIDGLLTAIPRKWKTDQTLIVDNLVTKITYSFPGLGNSNKLFNYQDNIDPISFTEQQASDIRLAFNKLSNYINVEFIEIKEINNNVGTLRLAIKEITDQNGLHLPSIVASAYLPSEEPKGGDIWFNTNYRNSNFASGLVLDSKVSFGDITILYHEILHSLGLDHPNNNSNISFPNNKNFREYTLMADTFSKKNSGNLASTFTVNSKSYAVASSLMVYDIASLQYLYGANLSYNVNDTTYTFNPNTPFIKTIWDAGGVDTLDFNNFSKRQIISLVDGEYSTIGFDVDWSLVDNLGIAFNAIIENVKGGSAADTITGNKYKNNIQGNSGNDTIDGGPDYDIANYTGNFSEYSFSIENKIVTVTDNRSSTNDGIDRLSNIEKLTFANQNALVTSQEIKAIHSLGFQLEKVYAGKSDTYKFYNLGSDKYGVGTSAGIDELTGESILKFDDKNLNLTNDIKATFDQVTGLNTDSGKMFRLYNASFKRLPDPDGLRYWIGNFSTGKDDERAVASSFLASAEFQQRYGNNIPDAIFVNTLYKNVLNRDADTEGLNYWVGNLSNGVEERHEVLLGFSESTENKGLFSEMTGLL